MDLRVFSCKLWLLSSACMCLHAEELTDLELLNVGRNALQKRSEVRGERKKKEAFRGALDGLTDEQKIRAVVYRVLASDDDPKYEMRSSNSMVVSYALGQDSELIDDWRQIGRMMMAESSPRNFYLISTLATTKRGKDHNGFIAERAHMLFKDGRVAKEEGEYTKSYAHDVSEYAYEVIVRNLRVLGADFKPPSKDLPHEEQAVILAKWLKGNWPGCEKIEIPARLLGQVNRPSQRARRDDRKSETRGSKPEKSEPKKAHEKESRNWPLIISGLLSLVILGVFFRLYMRNSKS